MYNERWCTVHFDPIPGFGSREHYFHFLLGYLLPGLQAATARRDGVGQPKGLVFVSCGPTMDARIRESCALLGLGCAIEPAASAPDGAACVTAPRWDRWLRRGRPDRLRLAHWLRDRWEALIRNPVPVAMRAIRDRLLDAARPSPAVPQGRGPWLLLRRSAEPDFYRRGGSAEISSYGTSRRAILNINDLARELSDAGFPVRIYEPGTADLADQIQAFNAARGVIGIRGAELANLTWMAAGSQVVMLATPLRRETHLAWNLARTMGLDFRQVAVDSDFPLVTADTVLRAVTGDGCNHTAGVHGAAAIRTA